MVSYLNTRGGVILLGCQEGDKTVSPAIEKVTEHTKDKWNKKLSEFMH